MGFNTVVLILNDHFTTLRESPKTLAWALTHPPMSGSEKEIDDFWSAVYQVADGYEEKRITRSALKILPTFHMDALQLIAAGKNQIESVSGVIQGDSKVVIETPNWFKR